MVRTSSGNSLVGWSHKFCTTSTLHLRWDCGWAVWRTRWGKYDATMHWRRRHWRNERVSFQRVFTTLVQELFENRSLLKIYDQCFLSFSCSILFHSLVIFGLVSIQVFPCVPHIPPSSHIRLTFWRFAFSSKSGHAFASAETCDFEVICGGQRPRKRSPLFILFMSCSFDIYIFCCFMLFPMCILFGQVYIRASTMNNWINQQNSGPNLQVTVS